MHYFLFTFSNNDLTLTSSVLISMMSCVTRLLGRPGVSTAGRGDTGYLGDELVWLVATKRI